ncbi:MAG: MetQ/NlpA family ABC transporter substrate-binding protein [Sphaerochaetaceae bacterium]|nr:MetQ/NlpA family ABC transporter substrate-binding protein [Spirochaetales bacterium]MDY5500939.1 MetQ/NlpA family ABC transporter substrate-binding protein [Sphaerochaetaceae bacterium]
MKKTLVAAFAVLLSVSAVFANGSKEEASAAQAQGPVTLKVGATPEPHAALLNLVVDDLAKQNINLQVVEFTDYVTPNEALENGELDANYFQHIPYLDSFNKERGYHLVNAGGIHVEPFALYSKKYKSLADIPNGATIAIPNDPTNEGRGLLLLQAAGLLKLNDNAGLEATPVDVKDNPKNLKFQEVEAASLPRVLEDVDAAVINGNYAIPAGLVATRDGLFVEDSSSPYVNVIAVKAGHENDPAIKALVAALKSQKVADYVAQHYPNGEVVLVK